MFGDNSIAVAGTSLSEWVGKSPNTDLVKYQVSDIISMGGANTTVEPLIADPPKNRQPPLNRENRKHRLILACI